MNSAPEPPFEHNGYFRTVDLHAPTLAAELLDATRDALELLCRDPRVAVGHRAAVGGDRQRAAGADGAGLDHRPTLTRAQKPYASSWRMISKENGS